MLCGREAVVGLCVGVLLMHRVVVVAAVVVVAVNTHPNLVAASLNAFVELGTSRTKQKLLVKA